jgi:type II secretory pathway pseudopilin PulG
MVMRRSYPRCFAARRDKSAGYNLVILVMAITTLNIFIAMALPVWSQMIRREKEEQLIFRGLQYAEALRVYAVRHGGYPTRLEQLIKDEPRSIRQLWTNPMREDGKWTLIFTPAGPGGQPNPGPPGG